MLLISSDFHDEESHTIEELCYTILENIHPDLAASVREARVKIDDLEVEVITNAMEEAKLLAAEDQKEEDERLRDEKKAEIGAEYRRRHELLHHQLQVRKRMLRDMMEEGKKAKRFKW